MLRRAPFALALAVGLAPSGCKKQQDTKLPICLSEVAGDEAQESRTGDLPPDVWFTVLLRGFNRKTGEVVQPMKDCSGKEVEPPPQDSACLQKDQQPSQALPDRALVPEDLVIVPTDDGRTLLWVKAKSYDNGDAVGPIAIAEWTKRGIAVRAIGGLRALSNRARLRIEPMGEDKVLVVESDQCDPENPKKCERLMRLVPMVSERFDERPLLAQDGSCLGPAVFPLHAEQELTLPTGIKRKFEVTRVVDFAEGNVVLSETVVIKDTDPKRPDDPPTTFRNANVQRPMQLTKAGIVTQAGIWEQMLSEHGSVSVKPEPKPDEAKPGG
jgi:hypothetical protein